MDKRAFVAGAVVGGIVGALLGVLFAPAPGRETRARIGKEAEDLGKKATHWSKTALERGKRSLDKKFHEREEEEEGVAGAPEEVEARRS